MVHLGDYVKVRGLAHYGIVMEVTPEEVSVMFPTPGEVEIVTYRMSQIVPTNGVFQEAEVVTCPHTSQNEG